jgi:bifunctional DNase/RNase
MVPPDLSTEILDTTYVFLWETSSTETCTQPIAASDDPLLTPEKLQMGEDELRQMSLASASDTISNEEKSIALREWIRVALPKNATAQNKEQSAPTNVLTHDMVRDIMEEFLEKQRADQLGVVDYASISAGASVIRVGKRATSPSLVDSLPLLNRLMQHLGLRFYGYGPEAALTPTFPMNALGQCWAFESDPRQEGGRYATLTVELGKPIYVSSVVVEHVPKELTDQLHTSIRHFRILGYEDADASAEPWHLGSFTYDIGKFAAAQMST